MWKWLAISSWAIWVSLAVISLRVKEIDQPHTSITTGYYRIDYKDKHAVAFYVETAKGTTRQVSIEEVETRSGLIFPKYKEVK